LVNEPTESLPQHADPLSQLICEAGFVDSLQRAVFSAPRSSDSQVQRVSVRPIAVRGERMLQFTSETPTQQLHHNRTAADARLELIRLAREDFRNIHIDTDRQQIEARFTRKEKCLMRCKSIASNRLPTATLEHNRVRNHLIPDGVKCPFLIETGIMSADGMVRASHSRKFRQINRYLEFIHDVVDLLPTDRPIRVIDFATHYLLTTILKRDCNIVGLDRRPDVVETCSRIADKLRLGSLAFQVGEIGGYQTEHEVDMVISLHACDTATDDAIEQAIRWGSQVILAVPCCQHELNEHLSNSALAPLTSYGVTKERFASLVTDTMRASLMEAAGYQTQVLEFIETEHTPKNLLLRGVKKFAFSLDTFEQGLKDVQAMRTTLGIPPLTLERKLQVGWTSKSVQETPLTK
jgi:hypothetical protein